MQNLADREHTKCLCKVSIFFHKTYQNLVLHGWQWWRAFHFLGRLTRWAPRKGFFSKHQYLWDLTPAKPGREGSLGCQQGNVCRKTPVTLRFCFPLIPECIHFSFMTTSQAASLPYRAQSNTSSKYDFRTSVIHFFFLLDVVGFCWAAKWISPTCTYILSFVDFLSI